MCDAAEDVAGLPTGAIHLKWPNDLVIEVSGPDALLIGELDAPAAAARLAAPIELRKLAGVLGESDGLGSDDPRVVVGIGVNADWRERDFPPELADTMTSLREASGGRPIDLDALLAAFQGRLEARIEALRAGYFDLADVGRPPVDDRSDGDAGRRPNRGRGPGRRCGLRRAGRRRCLGRRMGSASSTRARCAACDSPALGCNTVARPVFGRREGTARGGVVPLDRDRPLVEAARRDPASFDALYRKYLAQVYAYALYELADHHAAEDATERVFMRALAALPRFNELARPEDGSDASTFRVWLFRIARNVVANERRSQRRRPAASLEVALGAGLVVADPEDIEAGATLRDEAAEALRALDRLPDDRRRAMLLRFVDEMTTAEIAGVLGKSEGAVRVLIHRGLRSVARELGRDRGATR